MARRKGKIKLLDPLAIRFSQAHISPFFRDGRPLEGADKLIEGKPMPEADNSRKVPPYDVFLIHPFPIIGVISWRPKIRDNSGLPQHDDRGLEKLGDRAWFTFDNRRLCALQRAAMEHWPKRVCIAVVCLEDVPGEGREVRKFRTRTSGLCVEVSTSTLGTSDREVLFNWDWMGEASSKEGHAPEERIQGAFAEDLWTVSDDLFACLPYPIPETEDEDVVDENSPQEAPVREEGKTEEANASKNDKGKSRSIKDGKGEKASHADKGEVRGKGKNKGSKSNGSKGDWSSSKAEWWPQDNSWSTGDWSSGRAWSATPVNVQCPDQGWQYIDDSGKIQGPFERAEMQEWFKLGWILPELEVRCTKHGQFVAISELFPPPLKAFEWTMVKPQQKAGGAEWKGKGRNQGSSRGYA